MTGRASPSIPDRTKTECEGAKLQDFRPSSNQFAHSEPPRRKSSRKRSLPLTTSETGEDALPASSSSSPSRKRDCEDTKNLAHSPKKQKRGYAAPETYAHLNGLQDHLKLGLDVVFCGINPGYMSAKVGHHFANPTNHFWRCLHRSGFTLRLLKPSEESTLPDEFCLGLTDLVDRPSTEQAELSSAEMRAAVPAFLAKVARYRPRIVCFVGLGIWKIVQAALSSAASSPEGSGPHAQPSKKSRKTKSTSSSVGLQPYKLVYPLHRNSNTSSQPSVASSEPVDMQHVVETLFFAMPSTSGRVVSHQLSDKIKIFAALKGHVEALKESKLSTDGMAIISAHGLPTYM